MQANRKPFREARESVRSCILRHVWERSSCTDTPHRAETTPPRTTTNLGFSPTPAPRVPRLYWPGCCSLHTRLSLPPTCIRPTLPLLTA